MEGVLPGTVDRRNTHVTDEPRSASMMYSSPRRQCRSLISDAARHRTTHAADRHAGTE